MMVHYGNNIESCKKWVANSLLSRCVTHLANHLYDNKQCSLLSVPQNICIWPNICSKPRMTSLTKPSNRIQEFSIKNSECLLLQEFILNSLQNKYLCYSIIYLYGITRGGRVLVFLSTDICVFFYILVLRPLCETL